MLISTAVLTVISPTYYLGKTTNSSGFGGFRSSYCSYDPDYNTKSKQSTREIQVHPQLKEYLAEPHRTDLWQTRPYLFPGRHGRNHLRKVSADAILREVSQKLKIEVVSTHS